MTAHSAQGTKTNWAALLAFGVLLAASCFSPHHHLVAFGTSFLTFSALAITPTLLTNLKPSTAQGGDAVALINLKTASIVISATILLAKAGRAFAWVVFLVGVAVAIIGIQRTASTDFIGSGILLAVGFLLQFLAYTALWVLRVGYVLTKGVKASDVAVRLGSARTAAVVGSVAFVVGTFLVFLDAMS